MPRLAKIFTIAFWGIMVAVGQAQNSPYRLTVDDAALHHEPAPPQQVFDDGTDSAPLPDEPQPITNQEMAVAREPQATAPYSPRNASADVASESAREPLAAPLPIPSPPPPLDKLVTPVSHQESIAPDDSSSGEGDAAAASDKPIAASPKKMPLTPQNHKTKISLPPKGKAGTGNTDASVTGFSSLVSIAGSTGLVLGIFLLLVWIVRRKTPQAMIRLPGEAFEVLGRAPLNGRQQVQLLRCGNRLLLVSVTPSGAETLTEITDPAEVDRLSGLCRQSQSGSSSAAFKQIFEQLAPRRPARNETMQYGFGDYETPAAGYPHSARGREDRNV